MDAGGELYIRLLGPMDALIDGTPVALGGRRQQALLALLALEPGRPLPTDRLAEELWEGQPPTGWETTLRSYASRLRRAVGAAAVEARAGGYTLVRDARVDAVEFETLVAEGRDALTRGAAGRAAAAFQSALALWRGPALAGIADGGALHAEALRLEELRRACRDLRVDAELELGNHAAVVAELRATVEEDAFGETPRRQLALALYRNGDQTEALEVLRASRRTLDEELGLEPTRELKELERAILQHDVAPVTAPDARENLPVAATSFVGREAELDTVTDLLRAHRLVTLTGIGGSGKTRLGLEVARRSAGAWRDGVWMVDLTAVSDASLVRAGVAAAVGANDAASLVDDLRSSETLLLLDNCEHVASECAALAADILSRCADVRILATSRVPLAIGGEIDFALDPLPEEAAVRLFIERAEAVRRDVAQQDDAEGRAAQICREVDGLPLSIELAAARARVLSLEEIARRLDDRFRFLRAWQRVADPRHETLQATMDWSYELLAPAEQRLLRRVSVFAGGADLDAVTAVCADGDEDAALASLERLVDASLVRPEIRDGRTRYLLLETVRQYAHARFDDEDAELIRRRHAEHYLALAESCNLSLASIGRGPQRPEPVLREQHNLRTALDWAQTADVELGLRTMLALENFWNRQAPYEWGRRYEALLSHPQIGRVDARLLGRATLDAGAAHDVVGDVEGARVLYSRSREIHDAVGDEVGVAHATFRLGVVAAMAGDLDTALLLYEDALPVFRRHGDRMGVVQSVGNIGWLLISGREQERGRAMVAEALAGARELGWTWFEGLALADLAAVDEAAGRLDDAETHARRYLEIGAAAQSRGELLYGLALLASIAARRGDDRRALLLWASVEAAETAEGRFGAFDHEEFAGRMPDGPRPAPLPLPAAVAYALGA